MRDERPRYEGVTPTLTTPERILVGMVVVVMVAFEIWFFFFSASPIDNRSGRSAAPVRPAAVSHAAADQLPKKPEPAENRRGRSPPLTAGGVAEEPLWPDGSPSTTGPQPEVTPSLNVLWPRPTDGGRAG